MRASFTLSLVVAALSFFVPQPLRAEPTVQIAQADTEQRLTLARRMMDATGASAAVLQMMDQMMPAMTAIIAQGNPGKDREIRQLMEAVIDPEMRARLPEMIDAAARLYAQQFTEEDLLGFIAFYESPLGRKLIANQPEIMKQSMAVGQAWGRRVAQDALAKHREKFLEKGIKI